MENLREIVLDSPKRIGACAVGIASLERLEGVAAMDDSTRALYE
jgi:hypothetical protein